MILKEFIEELILLAERQSYVVSAWNKLKHWPLVGRFARMLPRKEKRTLPRPLAPVSTGLNADFLQAKNRVQLIEGMFSDFSMAVVDSLLSKQIQTGDILEIGVYRGRSAALLGRHLRGNERLILVDINDYLDRTSVAPFAGSVDLKICSSEALKSDYPDTYNSLKKNCRFIHIDASHAYRPTLAELKIADELLLKSGGIIAMDDFTNLNYGQNIAAIFKYLHTSGTDLELFLVSDEKGYLCRKSDLEEWTAFILGQLLGYMADRDVPDACLSRTDSDPDYRAIYVRRQENGEGHLYGEAIYGNLYRSL